MNTKHENQQKHRIFVSYAHNDNTPYGVKKTKWISDLVENVRGRLTHWANKPEIITDHMFYKNGDLDQRIKEEVEKSCLFIPILSKSYLKSYYCKEERRIFQEKYFSDYHLRIIPVEKDEITEGNPFDWCFRNSFWLKDPGKQRAQTLCLSTSTPSENHEYFIKIEELTESICDSLTRLDNRAKKNMMNNEKLLYVYLAEPTDNLWYQYFEVKKHLKNKGCYVLPEQSYKSLFQNDLKTAKKEIKKDIQKSSIFIQFIEPNFCKETDKMTPADNYCILQNSYSKNKSLKNKFLWIPQNIINDDERTKLESFDWLQNQHFHYNNIDDFKNTLNDELEPYLEEYKRNDRFFSDFSGQQDGLMLVSGNIPVSEVKKRIHSLMTDTKPVNNLFIEYLDSCRSHLLFINQNSLSDERNFQLYKYSNNDLIPLNINHY